MPGWNCACPGRFSTLVVYLTHAFIKTIVTYLKSVAAENAVDSASCSPAVYALRLADKAEISSCTHLSLIKQMPMCEISSCTFSPPGFGGLHVNYDILRLRIENVNYVCDVMYVYNK